MPISRMQNPRQLYGLGSFVKKITRPLKKVFKSPIGKAAMLGLGAYGLGGGFGAGGFKFGNILGKAGMMRPGQGFGGGSGLMGMFSKAKNALGSGALGNLFSGGNIGKGAMALGLGGGLASMMAKQPEEEEEEYIDRIRTLKPYLSKYYKNANPLASDEEVEQFIEDSTVEYSKDGGLIGYRKGGDVKDKININIDVRNPSKKDEYIKMAKGPKDWEYDDRDIMEIMRDEYGTTAEQQFEDEFGPWPFKEGGPVEEEQIEDQETVTEDVETPSGMEKLQETLTEVAKVLYRATPVGQAMFTYDEAKKLYEGLPDISKEMIHQIGKGLVGLTPIGAMTAGGKGLATLLKGGIGQEDAQDMLGHREKVTRKPEESETITEEDVVSRTPAVNGGLMDLGGYEKDYRMGGFVPLGKKERKDDVPARLSKNEFVFTADAVKAAGGGSVDKGAQKMYDTMKRLENRIA